MDIAFKDIRELLGGRVKIMLTGNKPNKKIQKKTKY